VDWCDGYAYCQAVGKRLCGKIGGGTNGATEYTNANVSQWYNACSSHGMNEFPYGDSRNAQACAGPDYAGGTVTVPVGSLSGCQSTIPGYAGVYDLSGNAGEWEDACSGNAQWSACYVRGGSFRTPDYLACAPAGMWNRGQTGFDGGFRCCSSP
jgi:hypothetical protein